MFDSESSSSRLAKQKNWEFTIVNDQFLGERNVEIGLYEQTQFIQFLRNLYTHHP